MSNDLVLKFGGTSVKSNPKNIIDIVCNKLNHHTRIILVLSALSGITSLLHKIYEAKYLHEKILLLKSIKILHKKFIDAYQIDNKLYILRDLNFLYEKLFEILLSNINSKFLKNIIITFGEKFSTTIYKHLFDASNINNILIWSEFLITTNENIHEGAYNSFPLMNESKNNINKFFRPRYVSLIITTGYVARDINGNKTTLGRNGSDFTATILASLININTVEIYSDVDGILTADPRKVKNAKLIKNLNFKQVSEMCYFGASVLHPKTLIPLKNKSIQILIKKHI